MIKVIKYETVGTFPNSRRKGNFLVGESTVSYGPTDTTGFYNGIEPIEGGYTLYLAKETQGPSIFSFNTGSDLLDFCNTSLGANQTTVFGAIDWINEQSNYFVDPNYFEFTVKTDNTGVSTSTQFKLPLVSSGTINFLIDWGDNSTDTITTFNQAQTTHTYSSAGTYTIKISGIIKGFQFNNGGDRLKFLEVKNWGCLNLNVAASFFNCTNMSCTAVDAPRVTTTSFYRMFSGCNAFNGPIGNWDISTVTSLQETFQTTAIFNQSVNNWNTSNVTNMNRTFGGALLFNQPLNNWNTSKVIDMGVIFGGTFGGPGARAFNQDIGSWDTSKVTSFAFMFNGAFAFNNGNSSSINNWKTSLVTNMQEMFRSCGQFNQPIGDWDTSNVTQMYGMFIGTSKFNQNIGNWNTSKVTNMGDMFTFNAFNNGGSPSIANWDTSNVTQMFRTFYHTSINQPIGSWNVGKVTNMDNMFRATPFNQPIGDWDVSKVTNFSSMWWSNSAFNQDIGNWNPIAATTFASFLANRSINISSANLDSIYINWSQRSLKSNVSANFGGAKYSSAGAAGRSTLINTFGWTIVDGGEA
jgi:surface protein